MNPTTVVDLFAGIGGFSEGLLDSHGENLTVLCGVDTDDSAMRTWRSNRPHTPYIVGDLTPSNLPSIWNGAAKVGVERGSLGILLASPPCQLMSAAGKRVDRDDSNKLFVSALKALKRWHPRGFILENVPQFFTLYDGAYISYCRAYLHEQGYASEWGVLDASQYGVPQRRRRGFLVAIDKNVYRGGCLLPSPSHDPNRIADSSRLAGISALEPTPSVDDAIGDLPPLESGEGSELMTLSKPARTQYQRDRRNGQWLVSNHVAWNHSRDMVARIQTVSEGEAPQRSSGHPARPKRYFRQAYARLARDSLAGTITTNFHNPGSGRFTHYRDDRTLTVREAARLQSFDDAYNFVGHMSQASRHVGNAVPPLLARSVMRRLARHLQGS